MKARVKKGEGIEIAKLITERAKTEAQSEKYLDNRSDLLAFQIGWLQGQIATMLENGNEETIERYYKKITR